MYAKLPSENNTGAARPEAGQDSDDVTAVGEVEECLGSVCRDPSYDISKARVQMHGTDDINSTSTYDIVLG